MNRERRQTHAPRQQHARGFLVLSVGIVGRWFHFARRVGRGRRATAFCVMPFKFERGVSFAGQTKGGFYYECSLGTRTSGLTVAVKRICSLSEVVRGIRRQDMGQAV